MIATYYPRVAPARYLLPIVSRLVSRRQGLALYAIRWDRMHEPIRQTVVWKRSPLRVTNPGHERLGSVEP